MLFRSGAVCLQMWHEYLAWPALPPSRSCSPSLPPPLFVVASAIFMLISRVVCFAGLALPILLPLADNRWAPGERDQEERAAPLQAAGGVPLVGNGVTAPLQAAAGGQDSQTQAAAAGSKMRNRAGAHNYERWAREGLVRKLVRRRKHAGGGKGHNALAWKAC